MQCFRRWVRSQCGCAEPRLGALEGGNGEEEADVADVGSWLKCRREGREASDQLFSGLRGRPVTESQGERSVGGARWQQQQGVQVDTFQWPLDEA